MLTPQNDRFLGLVLSNRSARATSRCVTSLKEVFFGKNCRSNPFAFSLHPRSHEWYGYAKYTSIPVSISIYSWHANSVPLSYVIVCRFFFGSQFIRSRVLFRTSSVVPSSILSARIKPLLRST